MDLIDLVKFCEDNKVVDDFYKFMKNVQFFNNQFISFDGLKAECGTINIITFLANKKYNKPIELKIIKEIKDGENRKKITEIDRSLNSDGIEFLIEGQSVLKSILMRKK